MSNKIRLNKHTGELFIYSPSSIEDRAIIMKKVDGILSFPIKVETMKGNKEDKEKIIYGLYYEDTLLQDNVLLLTYENRDDAISTRKDIEKVYFKNDYSTTNVLKILLVIIILIICSKYFLSKNPASITKQEIPISQENIANPKYDREAIMKNVEEFKEKQKNALQKQNNNDSIGLSSEDKNNTALSSNEEMKTQGQDFADFLNEKK